MRPAMHVFIYNLMLISVFIQPGFAETLLQGTVSTPAAKDMAFSLSANSRKDIIDGEIQLGNKRFRIAKESRLGLIGANRNDSDYADGKNSQQNSAEFAIFSSSFSDQTAVGQPWVAALNYINCDQDYNSFLALYHIAGAAAVDSLKDIPYKQLTDDLANSTQSTVYCFVSRPPQ